MGSRRSWIHVSAGALAASLAMVVSGCTSGPETATAPVSSAAVVVPASSVTPEAVGSNVVFVDVRTRSVTPLPSALTAFEEASDYRRSPDGEEFVFRADVEDGSSHQLFLGSIDGSDVRQLTDEPLAATGGRWSPDGSRIVFLSGGFLTSRLKVIDVASGEVERVPGVPRGVWEPSFSHDGRTILFSMATPTPRGGWRVDLWTVPVGGGSPTRLIRYGGYAAYSPDGSTIAYHRTTPQPSAFCGKCWWVEGGLSLANSDGREELGMSQGGMIAPPQAQHHERRPLVPQRLPRDAHRVRGRQRKRRCRRSRPPIGEGRSPRRRLVAHLVRRSHGGGDEMTAPISRRRFLQTSAAIGATASAVGAVGLGAMPGGSSASAAPSDPFPWSEATIADLQAAMESGQTTARRITLDHLERIEALDWAGPRVNSMIEVNPDAESIAHALDQERADGHVRGPLHGIPIVLKDCIATDDRMQTTVGSLALLGSRVPRDAGVASKLREAGAVLLGKANMSEWNAFRGWPLHGGWSARAGMGRNPYDLSRSTGDSSSGSAAAVAASFAAASIGLETYGSIVMPSSLCGVVGLKPTHGLDQPRRIDRHRPQP